MTAAEIAAHLEQRLPGRVKDRKLDAIDPFLVVEAARPVGDGRLARARNLRPVRRPLHRPPRPDAHLARRGLGGAPAAEGLRVPPGVPRHPGALTWRSGPSPAESFSAKRSSSTGTAGP